VFHFLESEFDTPLFALEVDNAFAPKVDKLQVDRSEVCETGHTVAELSAAVETRPVQVVAALQLDEVFRDVPAVQIVLLQQTHRTLRHAQLVAVPVFLELRVLQLLDYPALDLFGLLLVFVAGLHTVLLQILFLELLQKGCDAVVHVFREVVQTQQNQLREIAVQHDEEDATHQRVQSKECDDDVLVGLHIRTRDQLEVVAQERDLDQERQLPELEQAVEQDDHHDRQTLFVPTVCFIFHHDCDQHRNHYVDE